MPETNSPPTFDEQVYALSKIVHQAKIHKDTSQKYPPSQRKNLRLLDDVALLLLTGPSSKVAAVSFQQRPTDVIFYYAKNRPATHKEKAYIQQVITILRSPQGPGRTNQIFELVLRNCRPKIFSRLDKLGRALIRLTPDARGIQCDTDGDLHQYLRRKLGVWYPEQTSAVTFVDGFVSHLCHLATTSTLPDAAALSQIIRVAQVTGCFRPELTVYPDRTVAKRMILLGDYFSAVNRIVRRMHSITRTTPPTIRFQEVYYPPCFTSQADPLTHAVAPNPSTRYTPHANRLPLDREPLCCQLEGTAYLPLRPEERVPSHGHNRSWRVAATDVHRAPRVCRSVVHGVAPAFLGGCADRVL